MRDSGMEGVLKLLIKGIGHFGHTLVDLLYSRPSVGTITCMVTWRLTFFVYQL